MHGYHYHYQNYYQHHQGWHHGCWNNWYKYPGVWLGTAAAASWLLGPKTTYVYSNPFYVASPTVVSEPALDYSQPLSVPEPSPPSAASPETVGSGDSPPIPQENEEIAVPPEVMKSFEAARTAFERRDYRKAQSEVEKAIAVLPSDAALHEFRALTLFAQGKYKEAAAAIYAVLAVGPGWNWETLRSFYPDAKTYTQQLRALEDYEKTHRQSSDAAFLLAYHYLMLGYTPNAVNQLKQFAKLVPDDKLAPQFIEAFAPPDASKANQTNQR
ncbi:MAG TPA: tetratricopeptide repeat protein, partial [Gemmataceae bacterium]|nr:tetratricopeptide repeat protein [Gemmataceae bacterium]